MKNPFDGWHTIIVYCSSFIIMACKSVKIDKEVRMAEFSRQSIDFGCTPVLPSPAISENVK